MLKFCLVFAETTQQLVSIGGKNEVEKIAGLVSDATSDASELCRHVKRVDKCKRILDDIRDADQAEEGFPKKIVKVERARHHLKRGCTERTLWRFTETDADELVARRAFSAQDVSGKIGNPIATLHRQNTQTKVRESLMASRSSEVWCNSEPSQLLRSFTGLKQIYSGETPTLSTFNAFVHYPFLVVWLEFTERKRKYIIDHRCTFLMFLPVGITKQEVEDELEVDESVSRYGLTSLDVVPLEIFTQ